MPKKRTVLLTSVPCELRDRVAAALESEGATVLAAPSLCGAERLLRFFKCHAVVGIVGSRFADASKVPRTADALGLGGRPVPRFIAIDVTGGAAPLDGWDAVVAGDAADLLREVCDEVGRAARP